jgi:hypothetical protein
VADLAGDRAHEAVGELGREEAAAAASHAEEVGGQARRMGDSIRAAVEAKVRSQTRRP